MSARPHRHRHAITVCNDHRCRAPIHLRPPTRIVSLEHMRESGSWAIHIQPYLLARYSVVTDVARRRTRIERLPSLQGQEQFVRPLFFDERAGDRLLRKETDHSVGKKRCAWKRGRYLIQVVVPGLTRLFQIRALVGGDYKPSAGCL